MKIRKSLPCAVLSMLIALVPGAYAEESAAPAAQAAPVAHASKQATYATPEQAAAALAAAVRAMDAKALLTVVGPASASWVSSGDNVSDRADWKEFLELYETKHDFVSEGESRKTLTVGNDAWPFPAPLVSKGGRWHFDAEAGRDEVLKRRVGHNELDTIQTLLAIVDAQREYAMTDHGSGGAPEYARKILSSPGRRDGLYWVTADHEPPSPLGHLIAEATEQGYVVNGDAPRPYHGYLFRMMTTQGPSAPGGARDYVVRGRMIGGFAVIAWPAKYGVSGIMTFVVNHDGVVYQKDLGDSTPDLVAKIDAFDPDKSWKRAED
jgi:hypothetical protein